jgi:hypothetical protein
MKIHPVIVIIYLRGVFKLPTIVSLFLGLYVRNSLHDICTSFLSVFLSFFGWGNVFIKDISYLMTVNEVRFIWLPQTRTVF